jgi:hypothetical protein
MAVIFKFCPKIMPLFILHIVKYYAQIKVFLYSQKWWKLAKVSYEFEINGILLVKKFKKYEI